VTGKLGQERSLISGAGADFKHGVSGSHLEQLEHEADDIGLRDGLALANGERVVIVGLRLIGLGDELVPGNARHSGQDAFVADAALAKLDFDHADTAIAEVRVEEHGSVYCVAKLQMLVGK
jgi:hypothetical protein